MEYAGGAQAMRPYLRISWDFRDWQMLKFSISSTTSTSGYSIYRGDPLNFPWAKNRLKVLM
jgi:hypothetical protein